MVSLVSRETQVQRLDRLDLSETLAHQDSPEMQDPLENQGLR